MSTGLIIVIVIVGVAAVGSAARWLWCRRHPAPLRGDWWTDFERDFRRWASARQPRPQRRQSHGRDAR